MWIRSNRIKELLIKVEVKLLWSNDACIRSAWPANDLHSIVVSIAGMYAQPSGHDLVGLAWPTPSFFAFSAMLIPKVPPARALPTQQNEALHSWPFSISSDLICTHLTNYVEGSY